MEEGMIGKLFQLTKIQTFDKLTNSGKILNNNNNKNLKS